MPCQDDDQKRVRFSTEEDITYSVNLSRDESTPSLHTIKYKDPKERAPEAIAPPSSLSRPNYEDILRRVSVVLHKHIRVNEGRKSKDSHIKKEVSDLDLLRQTQTNMFSEDNFVTPKYVYHFVRTPVCRVGFCYGIRQLDAAYAVPTLNEVYMFLRTLFGEAQLSAECSIVCLIYVERLMEQANVPLCPKTWRPCVICGLLLASKVWQDLR